MPTRDRMLVVPLLFLLAVALAACGKSVGPERRGNIPGTRISAGDVAKQVRIATRENGTGVQVTISRGGNIVFHGEYGDADIAAGVPVTASTRISFGSVTKQFTAAAILRLVASKKLGVETPVTEVLPDLGLPAAVTIRQLLTHTSGLDPELPALRPEAHSAARAHEIARRGLVAKPGTTWNYNNNGYFLLGLVIEKVTGEPYAEHIARMVAPFWKTTPEALTCRAEHAKAYDVEGAKPKAVQALGYDASFAAGGLCGTAEQLLEWQRGLITGKVVSRADYELMRTPTRQSIAARGPYGMGLVVDEGPPELIWHDGHLPAVSGTTYVDGGETAFLGYRPDVDMGVAVLANSATAQGPAATIGKALSSHLEQK